MDERPKLRIDLEFFPVQQGKEKFIFVKDSIGLVEGKIIPFPLFEIMSQLNGKNSIRDIQTFVIRKSGGMIISIDEIKDTIKRLDNMLFLDSEKYRKEKEKIEAEFLTKKIRPCFHCGKAYPKDKSKLEKMIENIINLNNYISNPHIDSNDEIVALIAPHIDISVGSRVYGKVYREIRKKRFSRIIIIGVGHHMSDNFFSITEKDFDTPFGTIKTDKEIIKMLKKSNPNIISNTDFAHKTEHSIEFQLIFLQYLLENNFKIIPILSGPVKLLLDKYDRTSYLKEVRPFIEILSNIFSSEDNTLLIAGIDLSHIGLKFGHDRPAKYMESQAQKHDHSLINAILNKDVELFWEESRKVNDKYNVCGFSALSCFLELIIRYSTGNVLDSNACVIEMLPINIKAELLDYCIWHENATNKYKSRAFRLLYMA